MTLTLSTSTQSRMSLASVTRGRIPRPMRVILYGIEGVGKSTFASNAPAPIFLASEDGTTELDVARFPVPRTWPEVLEALETLTREQHSYETLVVDTLDWLEPICWQHVCAQSKHASIEDFGFGKGYAAALDQWRSFLAALERLRHAREMHIILIAHSWIKMFKNPEGDDFERYEMKLNLKAAGALKEWSDVVLFARYDMTTYTEGKGKSAKGYSNGARLIHTQRTAAYDAKNRYDLPVSLPLDWGEFAAAVAARRPADPQVLREKIAGLLGQADVELQTVVQATVSKAGDDAAQLARILDRLAARVALAGPPKDETP